MLVMVIIVLLNMLIIMCHEQNVSRQDLHYALCLNNNLLKVT